MMKKPMKKTNKAVTKQEVYKVLCTSACATVVPEKYWEANTIYEVDEQTKNGLLQSSNFTLLKQ